LIPEVSAEHDDLLHSSSRDFHFIFLCTIAMQNNTLGVTNIPTKTW
jgi:hypothetical protein